MPAWLGAEGEKELREVLLGDEEGILVITLRRADGSRALIGLSVSEVTLPDGTLIATIRRGGELIIPSGDTALLEGDRVTVIGRPRAIGSLREDTRHWHVQ